VNSVGAVNGSILLDRQVEVGGNVVAVNGVLHLDHALVRGRLENSNGGIEVGEDSRVEDGILVHGCRKIWFWSDDACTHGRSRPPRVVIRSGAVVLGKLKFEREVELYVSDRATIGAVEGATPIRFAGSEPPPRR